MSRKYINENFPHLLHGADYNPEQWRDAEGIWDEDMRLMKLANCNEMTIGVFSWAKLEPKEGEFDFSFMDEIIEKVGKNGGKIVLATPSAARPHWLVDRYPEVTRVNVQWDREHFRDRHNHCYTSPAYREKIKIINGKLAERYGKNPTVVAWHISNEFGGTCYCPLCQDAFRKFLKEKYGTIDKLNKAYWTDFWSKDYDNFEQIEPPMALTETGLLGLNLDWKRFVTHQTVDYMKWEIAALREKGTTLPVTTNMMPWVDLDYNKFAEHIDIASWDSYPQWHSPEHDTAPIDAAFWHDFFRTLKNRPFMLMESAPGLVNWMAYNKLRRPGMDTLAALQAVAHGSDTVQYFQFRKSRGSLEKFHGAIVDHVGTEETRVFKAVQTTGSILKKIDEIAGSGVDAKVALVYDWENMWALNGAMGFQQKNKKYNKTCVQYYKPLWKRGISVDIIDTNKDFSKYDLIIAPMLYMVKDFVAEKIKSYVQSGGHFYATYMLGMVDESDLCYLGGFPAEKLKEVFGIWNEEIDTLYPEDRGEVEMNGKKYTQVDYAERIHVLGAKELAKYTKDFYAGESACTVNEYGKGKAYYQAFRDTDEFSDDMLAYILEEMGIKGAIPAQDNPLVTAHKRTDGNSEYLFVENYSDKEVKNILLGGKYIYMDRACDKEVEAIDLPPYGIAILKNDK